MKIKLEYPYNTQWTQGYVVINRDNRRTLLLINGKKRSCTQYARYLLAVKLGRFLKKEETVDHIDGDKTNDDINNLQILSLKENIRKSQKKPDFILVCPVCKRKFTVARTKVSGREKKRKIKMGELCCSRKCGGKFSHITFLRNKKGEYLNR